VSNPTQRPPLPWTELVRRPERLLPDAGPGLLRTIAGQLMMDDEWMDLDDHALTWWGAAVPLRLTASEPRLAMGDPTIKLTAETRIVGNVGADGATVRGMLTALNPGASVAALWFDPDAGEIVSTVTHYHHEGDGGIVEGQVFAQLALLAYTEATSKAPHLAEMFDATALEVPHPDSGARQDLDEMLTFTDQAVVPQGMVENRWSQAGTELAIELLRQAGFFANGDETGITCEFPFTSSTPVAVQMLEGRRGGMTALYTARLDQPHPGYGRGWFQLLRLPMRWTEDEAVLLADGLNRAEAIELTGFPSWGAWCVDPGDRRSLAHVAFFPSLTARPGLAASLTFSDFLRSQWAQERLVDPDWVAGVRAGEG
jgi:hypothetical protein